MLTLKSQNRKPMLVAADLQRPGAVEQLKTLGEQIDVPVSTARRPTPSMSAATPVAHAKKTHHVRFGDP